MLGLIWIQTVCNCLQTTLACLSSVDFFKINFFEKFFQKYHQSVKQFESRSGPTFCWASSGSKMFAKVFSRRHLLFCCLLIFFKINFFGKNSFRNTIRVSNSLDPDQAQCFVRPDLNPNCLQRFSADGTCFFVICFFQNQFFGNTIRVSNSLKLGKSQRFVGPDLDPNCLQTTLVGVKS